MVHLKYATDDESFTIKDRNVCFQHMNEGYP